MHSLSAALVASVPVRFQRLVLYFLAAISTATAGNVVFTPSTGNWNLPANWSGGIVPDGGQNPIVLNGAAVVVNSNVGTCGSAFIGQGSASSPNGTVLFRPGAELTVANLLLGRDGTNHGQFNQSGGQLIVNGYVSVGDAAGGGTGASGELNLTGGSLHLPSPNSALLIGNQGVGRMLVAGSASLSAPKITVSSAPASTVRYARRSTTISSPTLRHRIPTHPPLFTMSTRVSSKSGCAVRVVPAPSVETTYYFAKPRRSKACWKRRFK